MAALVNPIGDFPLNDDWAFAPSVKTMMESARFVFPEWSAPNIFSQIVWGSLFGKIFGFSFTVLRFSTLTIGLFGILAFYALLREMGVSNGVSIAGASTIAVNPMYFALSNTFMTDVPFLALSFISLLFLTRVINHDNPFDLILGTLAAILALLVRQVGFAIPMAFSLAYLSGKEVSPSRILKSALPLVMCAIAQYSFVAWLQFDGQSPALSDNQVRQLLEVLSQPVSTSVTHIAHHLTCAVFYICLFALPLLLLVTFALNNAINQRTVSMFLLASTFLWVCLHHTGLFQWPLLENILNGFGIGPVLNAPALRFHPLIGHLKIFWWCIGLLSVISGLLTVLFFRRLFMSFLLLEARSKKIASLRLPIFFAASSIIYLVPVIGIERMIDRYLLFPIATVILFGLSFPSPCPTLSLSRLGSTLAFSSIAIMGLATVTTTHDYLSWNRVRWEALDDLVHTRKISPTRIDGGFEFNGKYLFDPNQKKPGHLGWWVTDNEFFLSHEKEYVTRVNNRRVTLPINGYAVDRLYHIDTWLPHSPKRVYVMHRHQPDVPPGN